MITAIKPSVPSALFTCRACQVAFHSADLQRAHYSTDWHRYNLKRRVAELPPVTAEAFAQKVLAQQAQNKDEAARATFVAECMACNKLYYSENAYANHLQSNKHKFSEGKAGQQGAKQIKKPSQSPPTNVTKLMGKLEVINDSTSETEILSIIDKMIETAPKLSELDCLFCAHQASTFDKNIDHMTKVHSFFIPDIEYLVDLHGLIKYLGEKIAVGNVCLWCNGRGKGMRSLEAVRKHMIDKGHCMIAYDRDEDVMDIVDYYDFTSSYSDEEWEDVEEGDVISDDEGEGEVFERNNDEIPPSKTVFYTNNAELVLPSGARIGHRSLHRYYKQHLRPREVNERTIVTHLITHYTDNFGYQRTTRTRQSGILIVNNAGRAKNYATKALSENKRRQQEFDTRIGIKANRLQKYFRAQIL